MTVVTPRGRALRIAALCISTALASGFAAPALAQLANDNVAPPPVRQAIDENGVDIIRGTFNAEDEGASIGPSQPEGLSFKRFNFGAGWRDSQAASLEYGGPGIIVSIGGSSDSFAGTGPTYTATEGNGATLTFNNADASFTYTNRDGVVARFIMRSTTLIDGDTETYYTPSQVTYPNGTKLDFNYEVFSYCLGGLIGGNCSSGFYGSASRLSSITNNYNYQLKFFYAQNTATASTFIISNWQTLASVKAINRSVESCPLSTGPCTLTQTWPTVTITGTSTSTGTSTNSLSQQTNYTLNAAGAITAAKRPGAAANNITVGYNGSAQVSTLTNEGVSWTYTYSDVGAVRTTTKTGPSSQQFVYTSDTSIMRVLSFRDPLNRTSSYQYDPSGRLTRVTQPEGNYTQYTYDVRGNATETRHVAKSGSGLADIVIPSSYAAACASSITCNKPVWTRDAKGNQTDYTYDAVHGGVLTVTAPAAASGGTRPQTRYTYGDFGPAGNLFKRVTVVSQCQTGASCSGAADEVKTTYTYAAQSSNYLVATATTSAGNGALAAPTAYTYDRFGNVLTEDGPLAGTADTARYRYDALNRRVGAVGADPDGAGVRKHLAVRTTYNLDGQVTNVETGNVNSQSDADWTAMTVSENQTTAYDANARPVKAEAKSGATTYALSQTSYDALGRVDCTAVRMDPAVWATQTVACTPQTTGTNGPDRVTKTIYTAANEVSQVQTAVGTAQVSNEMTYTYSNNGKQATVTDAENNRTTYEYDGFDRLSKTRYPSATLGANASSTTDFEQLSYDANSNTTQRRLRDGQLVNFTLDNLNRVTLKDLPGAEPDASFTYDLLGRTVTAVQNGQTLTSSYDALSRLTSMAGPLGTNSYTYDSAGRRTSLIYPGGGLTINTDYDVTGNVTAIRENGATTGVGVLGTYAYDNLGRRTTLTRGNGAVTSFAFDPVSRLSTLTQNPSGTANDITLGFTYNPASQIATATRSTDVYAWGGHYNVNRSYGTNGLNQLTTAGATVLSYDARGNLTASGASAYGYTSENLLTTGPASAALSYDPAMRLYQSVGAGVTTRFGYDGANLIAEYNASNTLLRRYVHGPGSDEPLVWYEGTGLTDRRFLHADERGSIIAISDGTGAVTTINRYDEYGIPSATNAGRFQYTGQTWLPELGMYYYKARIYSPTLGRFMQTDPIGYGDGMNWYDYVGGDPVNGTDPSGNAEVPLPSDIVVRGPPKQRSCPSNAVCDTGDISRLSSMAANLALFADVDANQSNLCGLSSDADQNPTNVNISAQVVVLPAGPSYITGTLSDTSKGPNGPSVDFKQVGVAVGTGVGAFDVSGTVAGFDALNEGFQIEYVGASLGKGRGGGSKGYSRISSLGNRSKSLGNISISGGTYSISPGIRIPGTPINVSATTFGAQFHPPSKSKPRMKRC